MLGRIHKIALSRTTMAVWIIKLGDLIVPLINLMHETQLAHDVLQMDETTIQVLKEDGRPATAKSFMWVRRGGAPGQTIILFDYAPSRAGAIPVRLLDEHRGYLQSDAYSGYDAPARRDGVIHVGCLDHARRQCEEASGVSRLPQAAERCPADVKKTRTWKIAHLRRRLSAQPWSVRSQLGP